ncbi:Modifier of mdg4 [Operophtera brumata]|uniref:Modifier of mdg4 n=1 Tax=Operophtera brumata TaxID=104452 RepID=A0A0L7LNV0_OPEBR|nr:Modifier of mdg4 [Operophtera brumata]
MEPRYVTSERGAQLLLFSNFVFRCHTKANREGFKTWYCNNYCKSQCTSVLTTDNEEHIVTIRGSHNHDPPNITTTPDGPSEERVQSPRRHKGNCEAICEIHFIISKKGNELLAYDKYTFAKNSESKNRTSWTCSSRCSKKCNAQVLLSKLGEFTVIEAKHTHPPPVFYVNELGEYVRVQDRMRSSVKLALVGLLVHLSCNLGVQES